MKRTSSTPRREERKLAPRQRLKRRERNEMLFECLAWVNEQRAERELPPLDRLLPGRRKSWTECPIARSLACGGGEKVAAATYEITWTGGDEVAVVHPPPAVRQFIESFDAREEFDELELDVG